MSIRTRHTVSRNPIDLRTCLFNHADEKSLVTPGDELVSRRLTRSGKPLNEKLSDDMWTLIHCIKGGTMVPRSILKNGKRDRAYLDASRLLTLAAPGPPESRTLTEAPQVTVSDEVRYATMKKELNSLKEEVRSWKKICQHCIAQRIPLERLVPAIYTCAPFFLSPVKPIFHLLSSVQPSVPRKWASPGRWRSHETACIRLYLQPLHIRTMFASGKTMLKSKLPCICLKTTTLNQNCLTLSTL